MGLTPNFWSGRRVLVTGHTGFKGSWLCVWLRRLGADVAGIALDPPTNPSLYETADVKRGIDTFRSDINDFDATRRVIREIEPEVVFHLAAQPLVRLSYSYPLETLTTNVIGTAHVLESIRLLTCVRAAVIVTSDKCYREDRSKKPYTESDPMGGEDPYSSSKGCTELVCSAYRRAFLEAAGIQLATARAGNVHGGGDWAADRLVPDFCRRVMAGKPVEVRNPEAIRPWQHVLDPLGGYLALAERLIVDGGDFAQPWNFGPDPNSTASVAEVVSLLVDLWGGEAAWVPNRETDAPHESPYLTLDSSKARERLGWRTVWDLSRGLDRTVEWYKAFASGGDVREVMERQIRGYEADRESGPDRSPGIRTSFGGRSTE